MMKGLRLSIQALDDVPHPLSRSQFRTDHCRELLSATKMPNLVIPVKFSNVPIEHLSIASGRNLGYDVGTASHAPT